MIDPPVEFADNPLQSAPILPLEMQHDLRHSGIKSDLCYEL